MARNHVNSLPLVQVYWYDFICEKRGPNASAEKHVNENIVRYGPSRRLTKAALVACIEAGSAAAALYLASNIVAKYRASKTARMEATFSPFTCIHSQPNTVPAEVLVTRSRSRLSHYGRGTSSSCRSDGRSQRVSQVPAGMAAVCRTHRAGPRRR